MTYWIFWSLYPPLGIPIGLVPLHLERFFPGRHFAVIPVSYHIKSILFQFSLFFLSAPAISILVSGCPPQNTLPPSDAIWARIPFCHVVSGIPTQNTLPPSAAILNDLWPQPSLVHSFDRDHMIKRNGTSLSLVQKVRGVGLFDSMSQSGSPYYFHCPVLDSPGHLYVTKYGTDMPLL